MYLLLWNLVIHESHSSIAYTGVKIVAYADDVVLLIGDNFHKRNFFSAFHMVKAKRSGD